MKEDVVIRVENLSKVYPLRHPVEDEFGNSTQEHWALKDVSFEIKRGESVGIIGPNGSGKSTLLKILAGVTKPTSGSVQIKGRVASILDIGAGFHPELSGRENVFLNGQIHGFSKKEIEEKLDEIVEFSGIEKFIDEPVKNYSNGMYLRLAFSIMAHLDFDVYLLDEVLSVGDAEFQIKCVERITKLIEIKKTFVNVYHHFFLSEVTAIHREIELIEQKILGLNKDTDQILVKNDARIIILLENGFFTKKEEEKTIFITIQSISGIVICASKLAIKFLNKNQIYLELNVYLNSGNYFIKIYEITETDHSVRKTFNLKVTNRVGFSNANFKLKEGVIFETKLLNT